MNSAVLVGLQRELSGLREVAMLQAEIHRLIRSNFPRLAQRLDHKVACDTGQVQVGDTIGLVDPIQRERLPRGQVHLLVLTKHFDFGQQLNVERHESRRHVEFVRRGPVFEQFQVIHFLGRTDTVLIDRSQHEPYFFQNRQGCGNAVEPQGGPHQDGRRPPLQ